MEEGGKKNSWITQKTSTVTQLILHICNSAQNTMFHCHGNLQSPLRTYTKCTLSRRTSATDRHTCTLTPTRKHVTTTGSILSASSNQFWCVFFFLSPSLPHSFSLCTLSTRGLFSECHYLWRLSRAELLFDQGWKTDLQRIDTLLGNWHTSILAFCVSLSVLKCGKKRKRKEEKREKKMSGAASLTVSSAAPKIMWQQCEVLAPSQILTSGVQFAQISFAKVAVHFSLTSMSSTGRFPLGLNRFLNAVVPPPFVLLTMCLWKIVGEKK